MKPTLNNLNWMGNEQRIGVDAKGRETRWYLWHEVYLVRLPKIDLMTEEEFKSFGILDSGSKLENRLTMNELTEVMLPIVKIMYHFESGARISVVKPSDTKWIYDRITSHLEAWKKYLDTKLNIAGAPIEDLIRLDRFANAVYPHATEFFKRSYVETKFMEMGDASLARMASVLSMFDMGRTPDEVRREENYQRTKYPERTSPIESLVRQKAGQPMSFKQNSGHYTDTQPAVPKVSVPSLNSAKKPSMADFIRPGSK
jgi:hypothetical protein